MCTLTICRLAGSLVITMNRDEQRHRHEADELAFPEPNDAKVQLCYPVDAQSGGTWFGVNNQGVAMALLNRYQDTIHNDKSSRGTIIPEALVEGDIDAVLAHCRLMAFKSFNPFDLLVLSTTDCYQLSWTGEHLDITPLAHSSHVLYSSSSVATEEVIASRTQLFEQWFASQDKQALTPQDIIQNVHRQQDPNDTSSSILMAREHTHTKSISQAVLTEQGCQFYYYASPCSVTALFASLAFSGR